MIPFLLISTLISFLIILISVWVEYIRINKLKHDIDVLSEELEQLKHDIDILSEKLEDYSNEIKEFDERLHAIEKIKIKIEK